jgi:hypothetical protein
MNNFHTYLEQYTHWVDQYQHYLADYVRDLQEILKACPSQDQHALKAEAEKRWTDWADYRFGVFFLQSPPASCLPVSPDPQEKGSDVPDLFNELPPPPLPVPKGSIDKEISGVQ